MSLSLREVEGIEIASKLLRSPLGRSKGCHKATDRLQEVLAGPFGGLTRVFCDLLVSFPPIVPPPRPPPHRLSLDSDAARAAAVRRRALACIATVLRRGVGW